MSRELRRNPVRAVIGSVVVLVMAGLLVTSGPALYRRLTHPLRYETAIEAAARRYDVDPYLVAAVIDTESGFDPDNVSNKGAVGLMQLLPSTAADTRPSPQRSQPLAPESLRDPAVNIDLGTKHLGKLIKRYPRPEWALAAYNAGASNADRWQRSATSSEPIDSIGYPVTRRYVSNVLRERQEYRAIYPHAFEKAAQDGTQK